MIYFDHNATTPVDERVVEAMLPFLTTFYGNPSSLYKQGRIARSAIDTAREQVAALCDAQPGQIIFTSGGTEANNHALAMARQVENLAVSAIEHPSVLEPAEELQKAGYPVHILQVDGRGLIGDGVIKQIEQHKIGFVSLMLANNETGVIQNVSGYAPELRARGVIVHTDAVQALGKIPVSFKELGVHMMTLSSHKIYGPKGCGALVFEKGLELPKIVSGGGQEQGYRSGTENVAAIVGFGKAAELAKAELELRSNHLSKLSRLLEDLLRTIPGARIFGAAAQRLPNTVQFGIDGMDGEMLLMRLDQKSIAVSSGSACASGGLDPSPVLIAMGFPAVAAKTAIRVSFGKANTEAEVLKLIEILKALVG